MKDPRSYGPEFNKAGGGYYAVERASNHIKVWFWSRDSESAPAAVKSGAKTVDPDTWVSRPGWGRSAGWFSFKLQGEPDAFFPGGQNCDINKKFGPQNIIINLTFCTPAIDFTAAPQGADQFPLVL
jgi:hypothetical protein